MITLKRTFVWAYYGQNGYVVAASRGFGFLDSSNGQVHEELNIWMTRFSKKADRSGPALWVGHHSRKRCWVLEEEVES
jgi:hypothetical protein